MEPSFLFSHPDEAAMHMHMQMQAEFVENVTSPKELSVLDSSEQQEDTAFDHAKKIQQLSATSDKKQNAQILAAKYTRAKRAVEISCVTMFFLLLIVSVWRTCSLFFFKNFWVTMCACVLAMVFADFFSGIVHWGADTWGNLETPLFGNSIIRSFREHHVNPTSICHHDFIEANGDNCMITLPVLLLTAINVVKQDSLYELFVHNFLVILVIWVALTNQIHKWSHTYRPHVIIAFMQKAGIIISRRDHGVHHKNPFDKYYCITNGWLNPILASVDFWKRFELVVTYVTGAVPREDDMLWNGMNAKLYN